MWRRVVFVIWHLTSLVLVVACLAAVTSLVFELRTMSYLKGFAHAIIPLTAAPEDQVETVLAWMRQGPLRLRVGSEDSLDVRDPAVSLNYKELLQVCGSATNAFVNLMSGAGLDSRRLLLLNERREAMHVLSEVRLNGRWIVVDPALRAVFRGADGSLLTRAQLRDPGVFREAMQRIPGYDPAWTYERTTHVRVERIPYVGRALRAGLDRLNADWEEALGTWPLVLERRSSIVLVSTLGILVAAAVARAALGWYLEKRFGLEHIRLRQRAAEVVHAALRR